MTGIIATFGLEVMADMVETVRSLVAMVGRLGIIIIVSSRPKRTTGNPVVDLDKDKGMDVDGDADADACDWTVHLHLATDLYLMTGLPISVGLWNLLI